MNDRLIPGSQHDRIYCWMKYRYLQVRECPDREEFPGTVQELFLFKEFTLGKKGVSRVFSAAEIQT